MDIFLSCPFDAKLPYTLAARRAGLGRCRFMLFLRRCSVLRRYKTTPSFLWKNRRMRKKYRKTG
ncbi:hypothetical protein [Oscillibacter sp.]|uniref:hypothetical protein n=1 Tax=Oscillibacter sp. TaxID=1945593 RepID=UPI00262689F8|nr:hypothetical protein [Oscillibacter sp.]